MLVSSVFRFSMFASVCFSQRALHCSCQGLKVRDVVVGIKQDVGDNASADYIQVGNVSLIYCRLNFLFFVSVCEKKR
jgi:hypothetical protein